MKIGRKKLSPLRLSWSAIQSFLSCQRKYELSYRENLQRIPYAGNRALILGSAFHAGLEAALQLTFEAGYGQFSISVTTMIERANTAAREYINQATVPNKMVKDYRNGGLMVTDVEYYDMLREVSQLVVMLLRYHIPLIGIGNRYIVPSIWDVMVGLPPKYLNGGGDDEPVPAIEWHFEYPIADETVLSGYIDTVLWDTQENQYVMVDWKSRQGFPNDNMALIDGQLHLYAAVVNDIAEEYCGTRPISKVVMWQMNIKIPSPASISAKTGLPNTGAQSYDTTWKVWVETLPKGIHPERYEDMMRGKLKEDRDYQRPIEGMVTDQSSKLALDNVQSAIYAIRSALESGLSLPAILSSHACQRCDFAMLCGNTLRYGGDVSSTLQEFYQARREVVLEEGVE